MSAALPRSPSRKNAHDPSRWRCDQPGLGKQPQMPRQARLRLAQDRGKVGDGQFGFGDQHQKPQPRGFAAALRVAVRAGKRQLGRLHRVRGGSQMDIKISLCG